MKRPLKFALACMIALALVAPQRAEAQFYTYDAGAGILGLTTTSTTWGAIFGLPLTTTGVIIWLLVRSASASYIDQNGPAVAQAVTVGGGDAVADLASFYGVRPEDQSLFGEVLRNERATLLPLAVAAGKEPGAGHGEAFADHLASVLIEDARFVEGNETLELWRQELASARDI